MTDQEKLEAALAAISYVLTRATTDPDFAYFVDPLTETWALLVRAGAALTGTTFDAANEQGEAAAVKALRGKKPSFIRLVDLEHAIDGEDLALSRPTRLAIMDAARAQVAAIIEEDDSEA